MSKRFSTMAPMAAVKRANVAAAANGREPRGQMAAAAATTAAAAASVKRNISKLNQRLVGREVEPVAAPP